LIQVLKRYGRRLLAAMVNDRREHIAYSYGWLNNLTGKLVNGGGGPERRPAYTWGVIQGAALGKALGLQRVSAVEFGVAGGTGLVCLEEIAERVSSLLEIKIDVYGFDTGGGLPEVTDVRDLPNLYSQGYFAMDVNKLKSRLRQARLILGPIKDTLNSFVNSRPAPVAFVSVDVDLYTSTVDTLRLFDADDQVLLPRVHVYLDDVLGLTFGDHNGERAAVEEFNTNHEKRKFSPIYGLRYYLPYPLRSMGWIEMMYMAHLFDHPQYGRNDGLIRQTNAPLRQII
jgi:hypothetical protein